MNKSDLISNVASAANISKSDAANAVEATLNSISSQLANGGEVRLAGFGTFSVAHRPSRPGRNPRTGQTMMIAASNNPKFKAGKALKDAVNRR